MRLGWCYCCVEEEYGEWRVFCTSSCHVAACLRASVRNPLCADESEIRPWPEPLSKCSALLFIKKKTEIQVQRRVFDLSPIILSQSAPSSLITFTCVSPLVGLSLSFILLTSVTMSVEAAEPRSVACWPGSGSVSHSSIRPAEALQPTNTPRQELESASGVNLQLAVTSCFQENSVNLRFQAEQLEDSNMIPFDQSPRWFVPWSVTHCDPAAHRGYIAQPRALKGRRGWDRNTILLQVTLILKFKL